MRSLMLFLMVVIPPACLGATLYFAYISIVDLHDLTQLAQTFRTNECELYGGFTSDHDESLFDVWVRAKWTDFDIAFDIPVSYATATTNIIYPPAARCYVNYCNPYFVANNSVPLPGPCPSIAAGKIIYFESDPLHTSLQLFYSCIGCALSVILAIGWIFCAIYARTQYQMMAIEAEENQKLLQEINVIKNDAISRMASGRLGD